MTLSSSQSSSLASWGMDFCIPSCKSGFSVTDKGATVLLCCTSSLSPSPQLCSYSPWILSCYKSSLHSFYVFFFFCLCIITQMSVYISPHSATLLSCLSCLCFFFFFLQLISNRRLYSVYLLLIPSSCFSSLYSDFVLYHYQPPPPPSDTSPIHHIISQIMSSITELQFDKKHNSVSP